MKFAYYYAMLLWPLHLLFVAWRCVKYIKSEAFATFAALPRLCCQHFAIFVRHKLLLQLQLSLALLCSALPALCWRCQHLNTRQRQSKRRKEKASPKNYATDSGYLAHELQQQLQQQRVATSLFLCNYTMRWAMEIKRSLSVAVGHDRLRNTRSHDHFLCNRSYSFTVILVKIFGVSPVKLGSSSFKAINHKTVLTGVCI